MNSNGNRKTKLIDLGLIPYAEAWDFQTTLHNSILSAKKENREHPQLPTENFLVFCEHPPVFTLGKSGDAKNLLIDERTLESIGATYVHTNRGGDITFHGPGQIVVYPVIDLENFFTDIHRYMRSLEEAVIQTLKVFSIAGTRIPGLTGVWLDPEKNPRKVCALGVKTSRWVTLHGLALNVNSDLQFFDYIVPCGIDDKAVTSMAKETGSPLKMEEVKNVLRTCLAREFEMELVS